MKIDSSITPAVNTAIAAETPAPAKPAMPATVASPLSTDVNLSHLSSQMQAIDKSLADTSVVDSARVAELKQAISAGHFKVNAGAVADKLISTVKELINAHKA